MKAGFFPLMAAWEVPARIAARARVVTVLFIFVFVFGEIAIAQG